jgi:hypothetical protein
LLAQLFSWCPCHSAHSLPAPCLDNSNFLLAPVYAPTRIACLQFFALGNVIAKKKRKWSVEYNKKILFDSIHSTLFKTCNKLQTHNVLHVSTSMTTITSYSLT